MDMVYPSYGDSYLYNAWVHIAVNILIRNIARADFTIKKDGNDVTSGPVYELFRKPNSFLSRYDLWKETAAWWHLEGEAFWWFGPDYSGGLPKELYVLNPRKLDHEEYGSGNTPDRIKQGSRRWFYHTGMERIPILSDELVHFRDWNPWNPVRGVNPLVSLALELEQDYYANKANSQLLKNNAVPQGILKTEQTLRPEEADQLERRWEGKYGAVKAGRKIAVLGKGTSFEALSFTPEVVKLFELKRWNLYTILAKYGIPPRVANISDKSTSLSGKDTAEQHSAFWKYTLIPILHQFEQILEAQFFIRFGLKETGKFDLWDIPELQDSEDAQSKRDIAEINAGLKTINDVLKERGKDTKPWGDVWYRPHSVIPVENRPVENRRTGGGAS
jgi:HK97 family phage portal protein